jgi:hypothetical protein
MHGRGWTGTLRTYSCAEPYANPETLTAEVVRHDSASASRSTSPIVIPFRSSTKLILRLASRSPPTQGRDNRYTRESSPLQSPYHSPSSRSYFPFVEIEHTSPTYTTHSYSLGNSPGDAPRHTTISLLSPDRRPEYQHDSS